MIKALLKVKRLLPDGKRFEVSDVVGYLHAVIYREIIENNTSDVHFDYVLLNVGGTEYDLTKCVSVTITKEQRIWDLSYQNGSLRLDGVQHEPGELVRKLNTELF